MNKHNKSLGKSSTNTASLSNAISSIKTSISPVIKSGRAPSNPKPLKVPGEVWIPRTTRTFLSQATTVNELGVSLASVFTDSSITGQVRILGLKVWNYTNTGTSTNYIRLKTLERLTETAVSTVVEDVGSGTSLPGVSVIIPRTIASNLVNTASANVCVVAAYPTQLGAPSVKQDICVDIHFEFKTNISN